MLPVGTPCVQGDLQESVAQTRPVTQGKVDEHVDSCGNSHSPGSRHVAPPAQSFDVAHALWHRPNEQMSAPLQSLLSVHPAATAGALLLEQLVAASSAPTTAASTRVRT
jgi:hypothetical protein